MRSLLLAVFSVAALAAASTSVAGDAKGCVMTGSWVGFDETGIVDWTSTVIGHSGSEGVVIIESPRIDLTLGGAFEDAVRGTLLRGSWERVNGNTMRWTALGFVLDQYNATVWVAKVSGHSVLSDNCNTEYVENTIEVYLPGMNPLTDPPYWAMPMPGHYGYRVSVQPPAM